MKNRFKKLLSNATDRKALHALIAGVGVAATAAMIPSPVFPAASLVGSVMAGIEMAFKASKHTSQIVSSEEPIVPPDALPINALAPAFSQADLQATYNKFSKGNGVAIVAPERASFKKRAPAVTA